MRPAAYSPICRMVSAPRGTLACCPLVSTLAIPSSMRASSAARQSGVTSMARWNTGSFPRSRHSCVKTRVRSASSVPSWWRKPNTSPSAPWARRSLASSTAVANSASV